MTDDRREWYIYVLRDPRNDEVRYVGFTTDVGKRFYSHIYNANAGIKSHIYNWIRSLLLLDLQPVMEVIERGAGEWQSVEIYWIRHYRMQGARLTNATDGGEGVLGMIVSQETREKHRQAQLGRKQSPEHTEKTRQANLGRKASPETIKKLRGRKNSPEHTEKLRQANLGRKHSPEAIEKTRQANLGRKLSPEHIEKMRQARLGRKNTPEHIEKTRQGHLGSKRTPEQNEKNRQVHLGLKHSPETIEKMREAHPGIAVRRVEDGMIFASLRNAARTVDRSSSSLHSAIKRGIKCAGYHWERVGETPPADPYTLDGNALVMRFD